MFDRVKRSNSMKGEMKTRTSKNMKLAITKKKSEIGNGEMEKRFCMKT